MSRKRGWLKIMGITVGVVGIAIGGRKIYDKYFKKQKSFSNKTVVITGGAGGLGIELTQLFLNEGSKVVIVDVSEENIKKARTQLYKLGYNPEYLLCIKADITKFSQVTKILSISKNKFKQVDVIINNAGTFQSKRIIKANPKDMKKVIDVNILSHLYMYKIFLPEMLSRNQGHITTISSAVGIVGIDMPICYVASKFAAFGAMETLRLNIKSAYGKDGIDTTIACPYFFDTKLFSKAQSNLFPILKVQFIANKIFNAMKKRQEVIIIPHYFHYIGYIYRLLMPVWFCDESHDYVGFNECMNVYEKENKIQKKHKKKYTMRQKIMEKIVIAMTYIMWFTFGV